MNGPWDRLSYLLCSLFPTPGKPALCSLEGQLQADSRQLKIILALIEDSWVPPPQTHTHIHTLFILCQRSLSQTCSEQLAVSKERAPALHTLSGPGSGQGY